MNDGGGGRGRGPRDVFETHYSVFSVAMSGRTGLEEGDKILLPPSAFDKLSRMEIDYPMLFELTNEPLDKRTHCGVLEFTAEEGRCYMPFWMMQNLVIEEGALLKVKNVALQKANFVKFRAQSVDFLDISNPKAVLEYTLRKYTCMTTGDMICLPYDGKNYFLEVTEVKPNGAASIIEADVNVDFDEPVGYVAPPRPGEVTASAGTAVANASAAQGGGKAGANGDKASADSNAGTAFPARAVQRAKVTSDKGDAEGCVFTAFRGNAQRIDGKTPTKAEAAAAAAAAVAGHADTTATGSGAGAGPKIEAAGSGSAEPAAAPSRQSRIGDKFSKKKANMSAFSGSASKLT